MLCRNDCSIAVPAVEVKEPAAAVDFLGIGGDRDRDRDRRSPGGDRGVGGRAVAGTGAGGGSGPLPLPGVAADGAVGARTGNGASVAAGAAVGVSAGVGPRATATNGRGGWLAAASSRSNRVDSVATSASSCVTAGEGGGGVAATTRGISVDTPPNVNLRVGEGGTTEEAYGSKHPLIERGGDPKTRVGNVPARPATQPGVGTGEEVGEGWHTAACHARSASLGPASVRVGWMAACRRASRSPRSRSAMRRKWSTSSVSAILSDIS